MAKKFKVTIRVMTRNPKLQTTRTHKAEVVFFAERIVGVVQLPEVAHDMDPITQLLTDAGPFDVFEEPGEVLKRIEQASE